MKLWLYFIHFWRCLFHVKTVHTAVLLPPSVRTVERRLLSHLWRYAKRNHLPIFIQDADRMAHSGTVCAGQYRHHAIKHIRIHSEYKENVYVLAHEIGHYIAVRDRRWSEADADQEAIRLMKKLLIPYEMDVIQAKAKKTLNGSGKI